jgi:hypothetical protein
VGQRQEVGLHQLTHSLPDLRLGPRKLHLPSIILRSLSLQSAYRQVEADPEAGCSDT